MRALARYHEPCERRVALRQHAAVSPRHGLRRCLASRVTTPFDAKKELRIFYKGAPIEKTYVPDFYCYGKIIVELKAVESLAKEHRAQLLNYLRLTGSKLGLLVNFGAL